MLAKWDAFVSHRLVKQILRFGVVGGSAFVVDFGLLVILTEIAHLNYLVSATCSFIVSVIFNYILSIYWVFDRCQQRHGIHKVLQIVLFISLAACGLLVNNAIMWVSVEILAISYVIGKLIATFIVMVFNFVTRKMLLEARPQQTQETRAISN